MRPTSIRVPTTGTSSRRSDTRARQGVDGERRRADLTADRHVGDLARRALQLGRSGSRGWHRRAHHLELPCLGPDLYGGTAGVGLFLAEIAAVTEDADSRRTALGALKHAISAPTASQPNPSSGCTRGFPESRSHSPWPHAGSTSPNSRSRPGRSRRRPRASGATLSTI